MLGLRIQWKRTGDPTPTYLLDDAISLSINKSSEIKNNLLTLTLKNPLINYANVTTPTPTDIIGKYMEPTTGAIKFGEDDEITIWAEYITNATDATYVLTGSSSWTDADNLIGMFQLQEHQLINDESSARIQLRCVDAAYLLFNKVHTQTFGVVNNYTPAGIIRTICRKYGEAESNTITTNLGTHNDSGTLYILNSKFTSEGGYIEDYRRTRVSTNPDVYTYDASTTLNGAINSSATTITVASTTGFETSGTLVIDTEHISYTGTNATQFTGCTRGIDDTVAASHSNGVAVYQGFPLVLYAKSWSPLFEWVGELSQTENTNYSTEIAVGGSTYFDRAFVFWIDANNAPHWMYPDDTVDLTITLGEEGRRALRLDKSVFDAVNFIIFNCGDDMYGNGVTYYLFDQTTQITSLKMRYQPMTKIINQLVDEDRKVNTSRNTANSDIYKQFPSSYTPAIVPSFINDANKYQSLIGGSAFVNVTSDATYNNCLRAAAKWRGYQQAGKITTQRSGLRYSGQITVKGANLNPGDLVAISNPFLGLKSQYLRIINVTHNINQNGWETTLEVQEDEKTIT